jgi:hypothetical protein
VEIALSRCLEQRQFEHNGAVGLWPFFFGTHTKPLWPGRFSRLDTAQVLLAEWLTL